MKRLLLLLVILSLPSLAWAEDIYMNFTAQGDGLGANCANARVYTFFNNVANWGAGTNLIGPGDTVHICGVWTGAVNQQFLVFQGSGTAGSVITLIFESGAVLEAPYFNTTTGAINLNQKSYILVDGGATCGVVSHVMVPLVSCNGIIRTTDAGSVAAGKTYQISSYGIYQSGNPTDNEIRNLVISIYIRVDPVNLAGTADGNGSSAIRLDHCGATNLRIHHNNVQHASDLMSLSFEGAVASNWQIYNNFISDQCFGLTIRGFGTNTFLTNVQVHDNEITGWGNWRTPTGPFHGNAMFFYDNCAKTTPEVQDCYVGDPNSNIYNNYLHGDLQGTLGNPSGFIHLDARSNFNVFNNLMTATGAERVQGATQYTACVSWPPPNTCGGGIRTYNNTYVIAGAACTTQDVLIANIYKNNIFSGGCNGMRVAYPDNFATVTSDYNDIFGTASWVCVGVTVGPQTCHTVAQQRAAPYLQDLNSVTGNPLLDANYRPQVGSAAIATGVNLTSLGITALNMDYWGYARPASGAWTMGAMNLADTLAPAAPTNITVQ